MFERMVKKHKYIVICMLMIFAMVSTAHAQRFGDNFGDHRATDTLRMNNFRIVNAQGIAIGNSIIVRQVFGNLLVVRMAMV